MSRVENDLSKDQEQSMAEYEREEKNILPSSYGCEILLDKTTLMKAKEDLEFVFSICIMISMVQMRLKKLILDMVE
jgi:hypothetical protein